MRRHLFVVLLFAAALLNSEFARAQNSQPAPLRTIGIVEIPAVFNRFSPDGVVLPPVRPLNIRARPEPRSQVVATVTSAETLAAREYGYEETGALVYARERGWYLVKTAEAVTGWLAPADSGPFHSLESLIEDGLTYLTEAWDGFLSTAPAAGDRVRPPADPNRAVVGFVTPLLERIPIVPEPFFESPSVLSSKVTHIETNRAGEALQADGSSPPRVVVFDVQPGWFQVALRNDDDRTGKRAWLQASALWRFVPAKDEAEARELAERTWGPEDLSVRVAGLQTAGGALWVNVELMSASECNSSVPPTVRARGWLPAHAVSGEPNIWFSSRGC